MNWYNKKEDNSATESSMKKIIVLTLAVALVAFGVILFSNSNSPAEEITPTSLPAPKAPAEDTFNDDEEPYTQFFCQNVEDARMVRDTYETGGDAPTRIVADKLVSDGQCAYLFEVRWWNKDNAPCDQLANGYCISIQPAFTYSDEDDSRIPGYVLTRPRISSGEQLLPSTQVMDPVRTVILERNY